MGLICNFTLIEMSDQESGLNLEQGGGESPVRVTQNEKGRALVANTSIANGTVVFEEKPMVITVNDVSESRHCNWCLKRVSDQTEPRTCLDCQLATYCCADCRKESQHDIWSALCSRYESRACVSRVFLNVCVS